MLIFRMLLKIQNEQHFTEKFFLCNLFMITKRKFPMILYTQYMYMYVRDEIYSVRKEGRNIKYHPTTGYYFKYGQYLDYN